MSICTLLVSGTIDEGTLPALVKTYDETCDSVVIIIDSLGGDPFQAIAIGDWLRSLGKPVQMQAIKAYSAASVLWMYGSDDRIKHPNADDKWLMWHRPTVVFDAGVNADAIAKMLGVIQWIESEMTDIYSAETGLSKDEVSTLMANETYFDDSLAKKYQVLAFADIKEPLNIIDMDVTKTILEIGEKLGLLNAKVQALEMPTPDGTPTVEKELEVEMPEDTTDYKTMCEALKTECEALKAENAKMKSEMSQSVAALEAKVEALAKHVPADPKPSNQPLDALDSITARMQRGASARF